MAKDAFKAQVRAITDTIAGRRLDGDLETFLNDAFPPDGETFRSIETFCRQGAQEGWMCEREHGGIRYGRVLTADAELSGFSVDVVRMDRVAGPNHRHPDGEIDMVMPIDPGARFDGAERGWKVYGPDSAHSPTVTEGAAYVLYLLPGGRIEFTR